MNSTRKFTVSVVAASALACIANAIELARKDRAQVNINFDVNSGNDINAGMSVGVDAQNTVCCDCDQAGDAMAAATGETMATATGETMATATDETIATKEETTVVQEESQS